MKYIFFDVLSSFFNVINIERHIKNGIYRLLGEVGFAFIITINFLNIYFLILSLYSLNYCQP